MKMRLKSLLLGIGIAIFSAVAASAAVVDVGAGDLCGNSNGSKWIGLTQDGMVLTPTLCQDGNSTGNNSPITPLGWISGAEIAGGDKDNTPAQGDGSLGLSINGNMWSITNPFSYPKLGISVKQGNGFAFYELDLTKALMGMFATGNNSFPTGNDFSHINAWRMGTPTTPPVPLPAAGWLLIAGLGGLAAMKRRQKA